MKDTEILRLENRARQLRIDVLNMLTKAGSGHVGGSLSAVDIITALYFMRMRIKPHDPLWEDRDKFVISKGHGAPALYAALGRRGFFGIEHFDTLRKLGSILRGHPRSHVTPGVEVSTGSLGQGLSIANGLAIASKLDKKKDVKIFVLIGDGENQEGQIWEAAMTASHRKLDNICAIIDKNGLQIDGRVEDIKSIEPLADKWKAFGWHVIEINGHDFRELISAFKESDSVIGKPTSIIAHTIKGKGVSFMENKCEYHGVAPTEEELRRALEELNYQLVER